MRTKHPSDEAFEQWVDGADQLRTHSVQAAFRSGWDAREQAPNTLIIDTTNAQMTSIASSAAAAAPLIDNRIGPNFGRPKRTAADREDDRGEGAM